MVFTMLHFTSETICILLFSPTHIQPARQQAKRARIIHVICSSDDRQSSHSFTILRLLKWTKRFVEWKQREKVFCFWKARAASSNSRRKMHVQGTLSQTVAMSKLSLNKTGLVLQIVAVITRNSSRKSSHNWQQHETLWILIVFTRRSRFFLSLPWLTAIFCDEFSSWLRNLSDATLKRVNVQKRTRKAKLQTKNAEKFQINVQENRFSLPAKTLLR